jgi:hypothetical protein
MYVKTRIRRSSFPRPEEEEHEDDHTDDRRRDCDRMPGGDHYP